MKIIVFRIQRLSAIAQTLSSRSLCNKSMLFLLRFRCVCQVAPFHTSFASLANTPGPSTTLRSTIRVSVRIARLSFHIAPSTRPSFFPPPMWTNLLENPNSSWVNLRGTWLSNVLIVVVLKVAFSILPGVTPEISWTLTNLTYNIVRLAL